ncbi:glycosyltransferase family 69 protein [Sporormia fimetaria CBS 119925]|uniref:Glycosyltransferase family 69 protein n=1 Tax=Sporormia fimetaria CBS 119925 TaxID=1340428 RepID=A0A6A6V7Q4_9PLEO|nr:glycosyltransferase family 69 protein [Sporormia fimetaria CBS 119925]
MSVKSILPERKTTRDERIFFASIHWNNGRILKLHWTAALISLIKLLGPSNVYVSILESGSWDDTKEVLQQFDTQLAELGVRRTIMLENVTHQDELSRVPSPDDAGYVLSPEGTRELRRIPYLARLRNRVMSEVSHAAGSQGRGFDKVVWLNDVVFQAKDVISLLSTNNGRYAAACSLDFSKPPQYYDTFALRDDLGRKTASQVWPFFSPGKSRDALLAGVPVPVQSCWNGLVAMDAAPFQRVGPLEFRGTPDSLAQLHLEASECCLIHVDNPLTTTKGVWINPNVRVGYSAEAYAAVNPTTKWPSMREAVLGLWKARLGAVAAAWRNYWEQWTVRSRIDHWKDWSISIVTEERGVNCIVNEMQVLAANGWKHI